MTKPFRDQEEHILIRVIKAEGMGNIQLTEVPMPG